MTDTPKRLPPFKPELRQAIREGRKTMTRRLIKGDVSPCINPSCGDSGGYPVGDGDGGCQEEQCEYCDTVPTSIFNLLKKCPYGKPGDKSWQTGEPPTDGYYHVKDLLGESKGGDSRPVWITKYMGSLLWGFSESDDRECTSLDGGPTMETIQWKRPGDVRFLIEPLESYDHICGDTLAIYRDTCGWVFPQLTWRWSKPYLTSIHMPTVAARTFVRLTEIRVERLQDISEADAKAEGVSREWCDDGGESPGHYIYFTAATEKGSGHNTARAAFKELWDSINGKRCPWSENPYLWVVAWEPLDGKAAV